MFIYILCYSQENLIITVSEISLISFLTGIIVSQPAGNQHSSQRRGWFLHHLSTYCFTLYKITLHHETSFKHLLLSSTMTACCCVQFQHQIFSVAADVRKCVLQKQPFFCFVFVFQLLQCKEGMLKLCRVQTG